MSNFADNFKVLDLPTHGVRLPEFQVENRYKHKFQLSESINNFDFLKGVCEHGLKSNNFVGQKAYEDRLKYELETIKDLGFTDYILLVWDVINFCNENKIPVGRGRGSAAGSLALFLSGVTKIDPIKYNLYFERFISKTRAKKQVVDGITYLDGSLMVDVDVDVCYYRRPEVLKYLETKFKNKTAKILTLNSLSGKLVIKECGKIIGSKPEQEMTEVTSLIPKMFGQIKDLEEAYVEVEGFRKWCDENRKIYEIALKLKDLIKNKSVHASGVLLSYDLLEKTCPTELTSDKEEVSSFDMNWVSLLNVKLDILGLRSVSVLDEACKLIGIKSEDIDFNDPFIYQSLQDLRNPHGLFQIEAETNFKVCNKVKPKNLEELSAVLALARPGALQFVDKYALYTNHGTNESVHSFFDSILGRTGGVCLYQEQLMQMAHKIGFTLDEAEILRRIVGKKKVDEVKKWKQKIIDKIAENSLAPEIGDILWKILEDSANYSFNASHSFSYAALAASTVYLKFKYPREFFLALLRMTRNEPDPIGEISKIQKEMSYFGVKLLPPHIVKSKMDFSTEGNDIRFGLLSIKGISDKSMEKLGKFKTEKSGKFHVFEAANEAGLNVGVLCALIQAGALDGFKQSRTKVVYEAQFWNLLTEKEKIKCLELADQFDHDLVNVIKELMTRKDEKGKPIIKESRIETLKKKSEAYKAIFNQNKKSESFANWYYEKSLLGYTYNKSLLDIFLPKKSDLMSVRQVQDARANSKVSFVGYMEEDSYSGVSKAKKSKYCKMSIGDESGSIKVLIFNDKMEESKSLNEGLPKEKNIVIITGKKMEDVVFADMFAIQDNQVYTKLSDLKKEKAE